MTIPDRQTIWDYAGEDDARIKPTVSGWISRSKSTRYHEMLDDPEEGCRPVSRATGYALDHEELWRTATYRWVRHSWCDFSGSRDRWEWITPAEAREWLIRCGYDPETVAEAMAAPETADPGRPEIGPAVKIRLPVDVLDAIDAEAEAAGLTRSAWIREALTRAAMTA